MALLTIDNVTQEALAVLHNALPFCRRINRDYEGEFGKRGSKIGDTLRIRKPVEYTVRTSLARSLTTVSEDYVSLTMDTIRGIDFDFTDTDLLLKIDDFSRRYIMPAVKRLASEIEKVVLAKVMPKVPNWVGTPNSAITKDFVLDALTKLNENLCPEGDRYLLVTPKSNSTLVSALSGLFQSATLIASQYKDGVMGVALGYEFLTSNLMPVQEVGLNAGTVLSDGAAQSGATIHIDGFTAADGTVKAGTILTFAGCNSVNPETKADTGNLAQFVVTADATVASNECDLILSPAVTATGVNQNVTSTIADGSAVTWKNVSSTVGGTYRENLAFHKDAFTFVMGKYELPKAVEDASYQEIDGFRIRVVRYFDGDAGAMNTRLDTIFGSELLYGAYAVRLGSA